MFYRISLRIEVGHAVTQTALIISLSLVQGICSPTSSVYGGSHTLALCHSSDLPSALLRPLYGEPRFVCAVLLISVSY